MMEEAIGFIKRQYNNFRIFRAYRALSALKEACLFPRDYLSSSGESSSVLNVALFLTMRCNARCTMCNLSGIINDKNMADIPLERIESLLDEVKGYRPSIILFGGEPFLRKDITKIVESVKKRGMTAGVFTNGTLLNEHIVAQLIEKKLDYIAFSLLGARETHDRILSLPGAYDKMVAGIKLFSLIRPRRTKVVIHATICEDNLADLKNIAKLGLSLGADLVRFGHPTFYSAEEEARSSRALKDIFKDDDNIRAMSYMYDIRGKEELFLKGIRELKTEFGSRISFSPELGDEELKSWYSAHFRSGRKCLFAWRGLFIYPNGDVYPCESISYRMGNVFEDGFSNIWNGSRYKAFRKALKNGLFPACARCCKL